MKTCGHAAPRSARASERLAEVDGSDSRRDGRRGRRRHSPHRRPSRYRNSRCGAGDDRRCRTSPEPGAPGRIRPDRPRLASPSTASDRRGHASFAQSPKSRFVRTPSARPASGSSQRKVPLPPKWPNVRGELRAPVQCGDLSSRSSKPRPQSFGSKRPKSGRTPARPGTARSSPPRASPARRASGAAARARRSAGRRASRAGRPPGSHAARRPHPERLQARPHAR